VAVFAFKGIDGSGRSTSGLLDAESSRSARSKLRRDGVFLTELVEQSGTKTIEGAGSRSFKLPSFQRVPDIDLALATRQAATLIKAGITLVEALSALTEQTENVNPGWSSSLTAAPPTTWRRSRTSTDRPAFAR